MTATNLPAGDSAQSPNDPPVTQKTSLAKVAAASSIGTTIEWYDFFIYGTAAALVFPALFFPDQNPATATLSSFATFAVAFFARPVGAAVFGHFGDRIGRKRTLVWTLMIMGVATVFIGLLPGYETGAFGRSRTVSAYSRRSFSSRAASSRASPSAENGPARPC